MVLVLVVCMMLNWTLITHAADEHGAGGDETDVLELQNVETITREEYIANYAELHNLTYSEAEQIDRLDNANIWNEYCAQNNLPQPRTLQYNSYYSEGNAKIWYVVARSYYFDGVAAFSYGAQGKVIVDPHTRTFVKNSFTGNGFLSPDSGYFTIASGYSLYIDNSSYTRLYISVVCTAEVSATHQGSYGVSYLIDCGYSRSTTSYWRKEINANFTETF